MFICTDCLKKYAPYFFVNHGSFGKCELCKKTKTCLEIDSSLIKPIEEKTAMKMEYSELKERFAEFHAEKITKGELISAIGLYQRMNNIPASKKINGVRIINGRGKTIYHRKFQYIPANISPRIISHRIDREEIENKIDMKIFKNAALGEAYAEKHINPTFSRGLWRQFIARSIRNVLLDEMTNDEKKEYKNDKSSIKNLRKIILKMRSKRND